MYSDWSLAKILRGALFGKELATLYGVREEYNLLDRRQKRKLTNRRSYLKKKIDYLATNGYIILGGEVVKLTSKGKALIKRYYSDEIKIQATHWDGTWHLVSYDIPNSRKKLGIFLESNC